MVSDLRYAEQLLWEWDCSFETDESFISWVLFINVKNGSISIHNLKELFLSNLYVISKCDFFAFVQSVTFLLFFVMWLFCFVYKSERTVISKFESIF